MLRKVKRRRGFPGLAAGSPRADTSCSNFVNLSLSTVTRRMTTHTPPCSARALTATCLVICIALLAAGCSGPRPVARPDFAPGADLSGIELRIRTHDGKRRRIALDDYVRGAILPEAALVNLDSDAALRVAQVQAILARTYALSNLDRHADEGFDLCASTHCQVYRDLEDWPSHLVRLAEEAVSSTRNIVVTYAGRPINAVFHADCGGHTSAADVVWSGAAPAYLRGTPDAFCIRDGSAPWRFETTVSALRRELNRSARTRVGKRLDELVVTRRDPAGRAERVTLRGEHTVEVRGEDLRAAVVPRFGARSVKSTRFTVRREGDTVVFEGQGFGHGVGLCQIGARARARAGHSPRTILEHYYPGTAVGTPRSRLTQAR